MKDSINYIRYLSGLITEEKFSQLEEGVEQAQLGPEDKSSILGAIEDVLAMKQKADPATRQVFDGLGHLMRDLQLAHDNIRRVGPNWADVRRASNALQAMEREFGRTPAATYIGNIISNSFAPLNRKLHDAGLDGLWS